MKVKAARILFKYVANPLRIFYWFVVRPKTTGVKVMIENNGKFLFIRNTYGEGKWTFPGGGVNKTETNEDAAIREVEEEVGISLKNLSPIGSFDHVQHFRNDTVYCFYSSIEKDYFKIDPYEILEARWCSLHDIPQPENRYMHKYLKFINEQVG